MPREIFTAPGEDRLAGPGMVLHPMQKPPWRRQRGGTQGMTLPTQKPPHAGLGAGVARLERSTMCGSRACGAARVFRRGMFLREQMSSARRGSRTSWAGGPPTAGQGMFLQLQMPPGWTADVELGGAAEAQTDMKKAIRCREDFFGRPGPATAMGWGDLWATVAAYGGLGVARPGEGGCQARERPCMSV